MKSLKYILFISVCFLLFASCEKDEAIENLPEPSLDITHDNIFGNWSVVKLNDSNIDEKNSYFYIELSSTDTTSTFISIDKMNSSFPNKLQGVYKLEDNIISGVYDYSFNTPWSEQYNISYLLENTMTWVGVDSKDVMVFERRP